MTKEEKRIFKNQKSRDDFTKSLIHRVKVSFKDLDLRPVKEITNQ